MSIDLQHRIDEAVKKAEDSFWDTVASEFPEATSGDFPPDFSFKLTQQMSEAVVFWAQANLPQKPNTTE